MDDFYHIAAVEEGFQYQHVVYGSKGLPYLQLILYVVRNLRINHIAAAFLLLYIVGEQTFRYNSRCHNIGRLITVLDHIHKRGIEAVGKAVLIFCLIESAAHFPHAVTGPEGVPGADAALLVLRRMQQQLGYGNIAFHQSIGL